MRQRILKRRNDEGLSNLLEYVAISGILMVLLVIMMLAVNTTFMEGPADYISYSAYTDIGNGVSTRIVDIYVISPTDGNITSLINLPNDVADKDYYVQIGSAVGSTDQVVETGRNDVTSIISLSGIGATRGVRGNTTGRGMKKITYDSTGV